MDSNIGGKIPGARKIVRGPAKKAAPPAAKKGPLAKAEDQVVFVRVVEDEITLKPVSAMKYKLADAKKKPVAEGQTDVGGTLRHPVKEAGDYVLDLGPAEKEGKPAAGSHPVKATSLKAKKKEPQIVAVPNDAPILDIQTVILDVDVVFIDIESIVFDIDVPIIEIGSVVFDLAPSDAPAVEIGSVVFDLAPQEPPPAVEIQRVVFDLAAP